MEFNAQIREMIEVLKTRRDQTAKKYDDAIKALSALQLAEMSQPLGSTLANTPNNPNESAAARARRIITLIMKETGQPMNVSKIADRAHTAGMLASPRGYKGVYADVARVLIRNQHLFAKTGNRGFWKLKLPDGQESHGLFGKIIRDPNGNIHIIQPRKPVSKSEAAE
jgi:hypothetical protein